MMKTLSVDAALAPLQTSMKKLANVAANNRELRNKNLAIAEKAESDASVAFAEAERAERILKKFEEILN